MEEGGEPVLTVADLFGSRRRQPAEPGPRDGPRATWQLLPRDSYAADRNLFRIKAIVESVTVQLTDWHAYLTGKGSTRQHANLTRNRVARLIELARARRVSDLAPSKVQAALKAVRDEGVSLRSVHHYTRAVKGFSRWLWRDGRSPGGRSGPPDQSEPRRRPPPRPPRPDPRGTGPADPGRRTRPRGLKTVRARPGRALPAGRSGPGSGPRSCVP